MTNSDYSMVAINKLVEEGYFKSKREALSEATRLLLREYKILKLQKRMDKTAEKIAKEGYFRDKSFVKILEEIHEEEEEP